MDKFHFLCIFDSPHDYCLSPEKAPFFSLSDATGGFNEYCKFLKFNRQYFWERAIIATKLEEFLLFAMGKSCSLVQRYALQAITSDYLFSKYHNSKLKFML